MINEAKKSDVKKMEKAANKIISDMKKLNIMFKKAHDPKTSMPAAYRTLQDWEYLVGQVDGQYGGWFEFVYDSDDYITEGTCGYGVDGELGDEPAGPQLLKKKKNESRNKSLGEKDLMKYLMKRFKFNKKKAIDTMKKAGFDISMLERFDLEEACQKGYMTHPTRKTKVMFGKRYRNCVKKEGVDTKMTLEQAGRIADNICINCGDFSNENLKKWFSDKWVNIGKKKKGGGHPPCGSSGKKRGYAKCVPASKAANMSKKQKSSATRRKRSAQNKAGRGGTSSLSGGGKKPIRVSTKPKK